MSERLKISTKDIGACRGLVKISWLDIHQKPEEIQKVFARIIPVRAELMYMDNFVWYECLSLDFDELEDNVAMPEYVPEIKDGVAIFKRYKEGASV
jgi:hypothetical protein